MISRTNSADVHAAAEQHIARNYIIKAHLCPGRIINPAVTRTLSCPASATFAQLHEALQIAFGWSSTHAYDFKVRNPGVTGDDEDTALAANIQRMAQAQTQDGAVRPDELDADGAPTNLLRIVEWDEPGTESAYVDAFLGHSLRQHPRTPQQFAHKARLWQVLEGPEFAAGGDLEYEYDFGDRWRHALEILRRGDATEEFDCVDGSGYGVAEDIGGPEGWEGLKEAYRVERPTLKQKEQMKWFETDASNCDPEGLRNGREFRWEKAAVNERLADAGL